MDLIVSTDDGTAGSIRPITLIAATVELLDADLLTTNTRHFPMFPKLHPPY